MATKLEELNVTSEELERFKVAFQDARFRDLFAQYAEEISDPENRRRYEQEISEMERERGVDIQFIHPEPGYVLEASVNGQQACYLNVCGNALVSKARCVAGADTEGRPGQHWSLPCTLSQGREALGSEGVKEVIYDVVFHPDTLRLASRNEKFRSMVDFSALDSVSKQFNIDLDKENVKTLTEKYKGVPQAAVIRRPRPGATPKPQDPSDRLQFPYPYNVLGAHNKSGKTSRQQPPKPYRERKVPCQEPTVPHYTIRHRSYVDLQDYRDSRDSAPSPVPKELVITVDLPLLASTDDVNLHMEGRSLSLESQKPAYKLHLRLPYLVEDEQGTAQFNKIKKQLVVTLPVVQQNTLQLVQDLTATNSLPAGERETSPQPNRTVEEETKTDGVLEDPPECPIFTCSQDATSLTLIIHVKGIDEHSITSEVSCYQCEIRFCMKDTNLPYVLFVQVLPQYNLNTNHIAVNATENNMVIELTKSSECFGLWKNLYFGVNSNSLQERRFITEENVSDFIGNGLCPTIPWSTLEDQPLINVLDVTDKRAHIRLNKPELEGEHYPTDREQISGVSEVSEQASSPSDSTGLSDSEGRLQSPLLASTCHTSPAAQTAAQPLGTDDSADEDEERRFKKIMPGTELEEDDLPPGPEHAHCSAPHTSSTEPVLKEDDPSNSSAPIIPDYRPQWVFKFDNTVLFELD